MLTNPVLVSIVVVVGLSLLKLNVLLSLIIGALVGGVVAGMPLRETMDVLINGMGGNSETALNYILLGALAAAIQKSGLADLLTHKIANVIQDKRKSFVLIIAFIAIFSQNLVPIHIAFIPILIPPLIPLMNRLKIDRRAVASALTFGLKMPYVAIPAGFGLIFHGIIRDEMTASGIEVSLQDIRSVMWIPGLAMVVGLFIAIYISYAKPRDYHTDPKLTPDLPKEEDQVQSFNKKHLVALIGALSAIVVQLTLGSLTLGAIVGLGIMLLGNVFEWSGIDNMIDHGVGTMGYIAFVMLVASGFGEVIRATEGVEPLVNAVTAVIGNNQVIGLIGMLLLGLLISMGIGSSFGTIPIIASIFVPLSVELGFSVPAIILIIGTAGALGDAGSPVSDSTLGPTAGLNIDGQHDHIWDTCVPTFIHYNIPLFIFAIVAALVLS